MKRLGWRHAVIASAVLCLAVAVPIGLTANDPDAPPALLIPILATAFFVALWFCGFITILAVRLPFDLWRLWRTPEAFERRARRAAAARKARARRATEVSARRAADSGPWWEALLGYLAGTLFAGGIVAGVVAFWIHRDHVGPVIETVFDWVDRNTWIVPLALAVMFGPIVAFVAVDHFKKRRRSRTESIEARRKMKEHFNREFSVCPACGVQSFNNARGRCILSDCDTSTLPPSRAPADSVAHPAPADENRFPMTSDPQSRWHRCADCGLQFAGARDCPACAGSPV